ncbi:MAG: very short patch repair endonuclease [Dehalococcoidia bacterium]
MPLRPVNETAKQRSSIMSRVRSSGSTLEGRVADLLEANGFAYRKHAADLPGRPDFVLLDARVVVFVDSCFWHGCPRHLRRPRTNTSYWTPKIDANRRRDGRQRRALRRNGWSVVSIWEHDLKRVRVLQRRIARLRSSKLVSS